MRVGLTTAIATAIAIGVLVAGGGGGAPGMATIWVADGGSCVDNASPVSWADASAANSDCGSLSAAVAIADPGDSIGWRTGNYATDTVAYNASLSATGCDPYGAWGAVSTANCVHIFTDGGNVTVTGPLTTRSGGLWYDGVTTGTITSPESRTYTLNVQGEFNMESPVSRADNVIVEGVNTCCLSLYGGDKVEVLESAVGGRIANSPTGNPGDCDWEDLSGNTISGAQESKFGFQTFDNTNVLIYHVYYHDVNQNSSGASGDCHDGAMMLLAGTGVIFRANVWAKIWVYDMDVDSWPSAVTYENNWFGCGVEQFSSAAVYGQSYSGPPYPTPICNGQAAIQLDRTVGSPAAFTDFLFRYNSSEVKLVDCYRASPDCGYSNFRMVGNASVVPTSGVDGNGTHPCGNAGVTSAYNVWTGGTCSGTGDASDASIDAMLLTVNSPGSDDLHLEAGSNGNNLVTPITSDYTMSPDVDIDGTTRNAGSRDAGSDER